MVRLQIERWEDEHMANGYDFVYTPHIGEASGCGRPSGHLGFYKENMYSPIEIEVSSITSSELPSICIYKSGLRSYPRPAALRGKGAVYATNAQACCRLMRVRGFHAG